MIVKNSNLISGVLFIRYIMISAPLKPSISLRSIRRYIILILLIIIINNFGFNCDIIATQRKIIELFLCSDHFFQRFVDIET